MIRTLLKLAIHLLLLCQFAVHYGGNLPPGFAEVQLVQGLDPTTMTLASDGRLFIAEKNGRILIVREDGSLQTDPFVTIAVDNFNERGLSGIVLDPDFEVNQYLYAYYTVPGSNHNRLSRFQGNGNFAIPGSETVLLDLDPLSGTIHNGGAMEFGIDGKLYVAVGDGSDASNAQNMSNMLGKILRLNADGTIPVDNPFFNSASGNNRAVWATGFRNPFTFDVQPGTGRIFVNDVGGGDYEEVNEVFRAGNYGWPLIEGPRTDQTPPLNYQDPVYAYDHSQGCSVIGAAFYNPVQAQFPAQYVGKYFFADYCGGFVKVLDPNNGNIVETFATGINRPLAFEVTDKGSMYYLERAGMGGGSMQDNTSTTNGALWLISYTGDGSPSISKQPQDVLVSAGESATFLVAASGTQPLTYQWFANGTEIAGTNEATYTFSNAQLSDNGTEFTCTVSNGFGSATSNFAILQVTSNIRPNPVIEIPADGSNYNAGDALAFQGSATDNEDGAIAHSQLTWWIDFHHDSHTHPGLSAVAGIAGGTFNIPKTGETSDNVWYRIYLQAEDSEGLSKTVFAEVFPNKSQIMLQTDPTGLSISLDGKLEQTPLNLTSVVGSTRTLEAPGTQIGTGNYYIFQEWEKGATQQIVSFDTPNEDTVLLARYSEVPLGNGTGLLGAYYSDQQRTFAGNPTITRVDGSIDFNWGGSSPLPGVISNDFFTARWTGTLKPLLSEIYTFYTLSDDGVRLWIDDELIIDQWIPQAATEWSAVKQLDREQNYGIRLEFFEDAGAAEMRLLWSSNSISKQPIPSSQLFPDEAVLGTGELQEHGFKAFPNPVGNKVYIQIGSPVPVTFTLQSVNLLGQSMPLGVHKFGTGIQQTEINTEAWPKGIYVLQLTSGDRVVRFKMIKH